MLVNCKTFFANLNSDFRIVGAETLIVQVVWRSRKYYKNHNIYSHYLGVTDFVKNVFFCNFFLTHWTFSLKCSLQNWSLFYGASFLKIILLLKISHFLWKSEFRFAKKSFTVYIKRNHPFILLTLKY